MDWQLLMTLIVVALSAAWLTRGAWKVWSGEGKGCGSGCDCGPAKDEESAEPNTTWVPAEQLRLRQRQE